MPSSGISFCSPASHRPRRHLGQDGALLYGMHWIYPCIQLFVIAPPASGKGIMAWLRKFIEPIHREIRQQVDLAMKQYRQDLAAYHALGKEKARWRCPDA